VARSPIRLLLATTNKGKARELRRGLGSAPVEVVTLDDLGISAEFPETGSTFAENARGKSLFYSLLTGLPTLADDSGLEIEALGGAPGVYSARFSGPGATDARNIRKVLRALEGVPESERAARFVCSMALSHDGRILKTTRGTVRGRIIFAPRGTSGFGYDPIFFYRPFGRTFGELSDEEKQSISHRGRALRLMIAFIDKAQKKGRPPLGEGGTARGGGYAPDGRRK
jgi:XTP/dITP diphosphohydrolase